MAEQIKVPDIGENVQSGKVVTVHIAQGDHIDVDDTVIELETEKAVVEIPSPVKGRISKVLVSEGDELKVGDVIAEVESEAEEDRKPDQPPEQTEPPEKAEPDQVVVKEKTREKEPGKKEPEAQRKKKAAPEEKKEEKEEEKEEKEAAEGAEAVREPARGKEEQAPVAMDARRAVAPAAPSIRRLARELGVHIDAVRGSGPGGRITEDDIKAYVKQERQADHMPAAAVKTPQLPDFAKWGQIEVQELETVRRLTAESTAVSWNVVPHVTQFDEADISDLQPFLKKHADRVSAVGGKLTLTAVLAKVCAAALMRFPRFNASIDTAGRRLIFKKYVNLSIAVDTPRGLLMPVIRDAHNKSITRLAVEIVDLAGRARNKKIKPDELEGGTFSISNQGGIGGVNFTPIIFWPQVAILGISRSAVQPRFIEGQFQPRTILPLSLSYDHRIVDGADAARFMAWICDSLEQPMALFLD